MEENRIH